MISHKEKRLVCPDRSAERATESVAFEGRDVLSEVVGGVEGVVAEKFEDVAVELVLSGLDDLIHNPAGASTVFRAVVVGEDFEFFDRIRIGIDDGVVAEEVVVVGAVDEETDGIGTLAADREEVAAAVVFIRREDACLQKAELEGIAFDERQIENSALRFDAAESCADGVDLGDIAGYLYDFFEFSCL